MEGQERQPSNGPSRSDARPSQDQDQDIGTQRQGRLRGHTGSPSPSTGPASSAGPITSDVAMASAVAASAAPRRPVMTPEQLMKFARDQMASRSKKGSPSDTLDLSNRRLHEVPDDLAETFGEQLIRFALGYNALQTLPGNFVNLFHLRYLNVRCNAFATVPRVLTQLPRLEILDISRNKITALPDDPGRLAELKVLCLSQNRLRRLPLWLSEMRAIKILKIDNNPLQWPPPHIAFAPEVDPLASSLGSKTLNEYEAKKSGERAMLAFIHQTQQWMTEHADEERERLATLDKESAVRHHARGQASLASSSSITTNGMTIEPVTSPTREAPASASVSQLHAEPLDRLDSSDSRFDATDPDFSNTSFPSERTSPERSFKIRPLMLTKQPGSNSSPADGMSPQSSMSQELPNVPERGRTNSDAQESDTPKVAHEGSTGRLANEAGTAGNRRRPSYAAEGAFAYRRPSVMAREAAAAAASQSEIGRPAQVVHGRAGSHSMAQSISTDSFAVPTGAKKKLLRGKKSLPDMQGAMSRESSAQSSVSSRAIIAADAVTPSSPASGRTNNAPRTTPTRPALRHAATVDGSESLTPDGATGSPLRVRKASDVFSSSEAFPEADLTPMVASKRAGVSGELRLPSLADRSGGSGARSKLFQQLPSVLLTPVDEAEPHQQVQRDSYFRRLSTFRPFPSPTKDKEVSSPDVKSVDASRGILFSLSQIHTALKQWTMHAADERTSTQLGRVLETAGSTLAALINALDRFDSLNIRGQVSAAVVDAVLSAARESVYTFRQVVSVLQLQLKTLAPRADVRYTRALILMLYGAMAEVSNSYRDITESSGTSDGRLATDAVTVGSSTGGRPPRLDIAAASTYGNTASGLASIAEGPSPVGSAVALGENEAFNITSDPAWVEATRSRRHAGSFGAQHLKMHPAALPVGTPAITNGPVESPVKPIRKGQFKRVPSESILATSAQQNAGDRSDFERLPGLSITEESGVSDSLPQFAQSFSQQSLSHPQPLNRSAHYGRDRATGHGLHASDSSQGSDSKNQPTVVEHPRPATHSRPMIDHHLLTLIALVTSSASGVWNVLLEHLTIMGVRGQHAISTTSSVASPDSTPKLTAHRIGGGGLSHSGSIKRAKSPLANRPSPSKSTLSPQSERSTLRPPTMPESDARLSNDFGSRSGATSPHPPQSQMFRKLSELREQCLSAAELTRRLQDTLDRVQDDVDAGADVSRSRNKGEEDETVGESSVIGARKLAIRSSDARRLIDESLAFVRSVTALLMQIKALSISQDALTAPELKRVLAQLATGCTNLSVHLHFCAPTSLSLGKTSASAIGSARPSLVGDSLTTRNVSSPVRVTAANGHHQPQTSTAASGNHPTREGGSNYTSMTTAMIPGSSGGSLSGSSGSSTHHVPTYPLPQQANAASDQ